MKFYQLLYPTSALYIFYSIKIIHASLQCVETKTIKIATVFNTQLSMEQILINVQMENLTGEPAIEGSTIITLKESCAQVIGEKDKMMITTKPLIPPARFHLIKTIHSTNITQKQHTTTTEWIE